MEYMTVENNRRERAIHAACEVFARYGYRKSSMNDIAQTANLSKSVLFKYFDTKENLYRTVFRAASDEILAADSAAREKSAAEEDIFSIMRRATDERMRLFTKSPWVYSFSYAAAFDGDPFVQNLVQEELKERNDKTSKLPEYRGIRKDIPIEAAKKLIFWVSQGFLEERRRSGIPAPETLKEEFLEWIERLEKLLKEERKV